MTIPLIYYNCCALRYNDNLMVLRNAIVPKIRVAASNHILGGVQIYERIIDLQGGQINEPPRLGDTFSLPFLPATSSSLSGTLKRLFGLTRRPSRALDPSCALLLVLRYKVTVRRSQAVSKLQT